MKQIYDHNETDQEHFNIAEGFFREIELPFKKTKEEVWTELDLKVSRKPAPKIFIFRSKRLVLSIAASIILLAGICSLLFFYTTNVYCPPGQHLAYILPDQSSVEMNADSKMSFKPFLWQFNRQISFEGEGFFSVEKGKAFEVVSGTGRTIVIGTSFNIFSRLDEYVVNCISGKVKVISFSAAEVVLSPEYQASVGQDGSIVMSKEAGKGESHAWINDMFRFTARPLTLVFAEIERQYDIKITLKSGIDQSYSGYFTRNRPVEETLALICKPFDLTFVRISVKEYEILQK